VGASPRPIGVPRPGHGVGLIMGLIDRRLVGADAAAATTTEPR